MILCRSSTAAGLKIVPADIKIGSQQPSPSVRTGFGNLLQTSLCAPIRIEIIRPPDCLT